MTYLNNALVSLALKRRGAYSVSNRSSEMKSGRYFNLQEYPQVPTSASMRQLYNVLESFQK